MPANAETFSIRLPEATKAQVDEIAKLSKRSRSYVINAAVEAYVKDRAVYLRQLDIAVEQAKTGVGYSSDTIFSWMESWGTAQELPPPKPDVFPAK
jgi:predicted transcriptional regulator